MAATVLIREKNGAGETATDKTSGTVRLKKADNATVDLNDPIPIPPSGTELSMEKWLRVNLGGTFTQITNIEAYTDGGDGLGTGVDLLYKTAGAYATPQVPANNTGFSDIFAKTSASPIVLGAGPYSTGGDAGDYLVLLMEVASTAAQGVTSSETLTVAYDEI
jgi:hypothetical protein